jgi:hypothetical protein
MFQSFDHDPGKKIFTIVDTDFVEYIDSTRVSSIWEAMIQVYSKRELNVWSNFARCFIDFCDEIKADVPYILKYINNGLGINTDKLEKYLMLV